MNEKAMQDIAEKVGFNETVFVLKSDKADLKLKYFTPGHEINLCGHATIAALYCLKTRGLLEGQQSITIETNVGILPISFHSKEGQLYVTMKQDHPQFIPFDGDIQKLAESIGLTKEDIDITKPIVYGSTGIWTLLVTIKELRKFSDMKPNNPMFPEVLIENPKSSIHPFCFETHNKNALLHARHFSSPFSGTIEDAVTGTASGVMGAYLLTYIHDHLSEIKFTVEQGHEIGKDGNVFVQAIRNDENIDVFISGTGVFVREFDIQYT